MKFLCGNCRAKYQIADEKIAARTLRMKCRRCNHDIVIRGDESLAGSAPRGAAPARPVAPPRGAVPPPSSRRGTGGPAPRPPAPPAPRGPAPAAPGRKSAQGSALGADFRRQVSAGGHDSSAGRASQEMDQWHVAINDVPVGPVRRDEMARKVAAGAVNGDSLCWREGFDDWRPMRDVPELASVLKTRRSMPPQPMGRGIGGRSTGRLSQKPPPGPRATMPQPAAGGRRSQTGRPAARSNVVPIGGRHGGAAPAQVDELSLDSDDEELSQEPTRVAGFALPEDMIGDPQRESGASPAPFPVADSEPPLDPGPALPTDVPIPIRKGLPVGAWIAIASAGAFGSVLAVMIGLRFMKDPETQIVYRDRDRVVEVTPAPTAPVFEEPAVDASVAEEPEETSNGGRRTTKRVTTPATKAPPSDGLSAEQRALLARMTGGGHEIAGPGAGTSGGTNDGPRGEGLNAQQLSGVVNRNRPQLQRCYEQAIRGMGNPPEIRLDVEVTVGTSGAVIRVNATGQDPVNLAPCIERSVRGWTFPSSGDQTPTRFPVVFHAGS